VPCGIGLLGRPASESGDYVRGRGPEAWPTPPPEGARVGYALDQASPRNEERGARFPRLADVLAVPVVALVDDAGETPTIPLTEVFEERDLFEEVH
jgi:hypothetical protein